MRGIGVAVMTSTSGTASPARLVAQRGPLLDAEAVLLVDDDDAERLELDALLDERVGADQRGRPRPSARPASSRRRSLPACGW